VSEEVEAGAGSFGESLRAVVPRGDFQVQADSLAAWVFVLDSEVGNRDLVVHDFEVS